MANDPGKAVLERHPFPTLIDSGTKALIVGTFPPPRFTLWAGETDTARPGLAEKDIPWYYGSRNNRFWKLVQAALDRPDCFDLEDPDHHRLADNIRHFLLQRGLGITDIIAACRRKQPSASDADLIPLAWRPVFYHLQDHPALKALLPTSQQANQWMLKLLRSQGWTVFPLAGKPAPSEGYGLRLLSPNGEKHLLVLILPSPSPRANRIGLPFPQRVQRYREILELVAAL